MRVGSATAQAICITRFVSSSDARSSLLKKRLRMCRTRTSNSFRSRTGATDWAWTVRDRTGCSGELKRPSRSDMVDRHNVDQLVGNALGILLLDELSKNALEIGERKRRLQLGGGFVKDKQLRIVQQSGGDKNALLHSLGVKGNRRMTPRL